MESRTCRYVVYCINIRTTSTYEEEIIPSFLLYRQLLDIAVLISMLFELEVVGDVHITRKQYLDGSIPTRFQRTGIIGVEGEIPLDKKRGSGSSSSQGGGISV